MGPSRDAGWPVAPAPNVDELFATTYAELRRLAAAVRRGDPSVTMSATALVNEAWIKLSRTSPFRATSMLHFKRVAARAMRQLLVESARRRHTAKRGTSLLVTFDESLHQADATSDDVLSLDHALEDLSRLSPRQAQVVEYRFFGGFDIPETAALLDVSEATVLRDWRAAKAWLAAEIRRPRR